MDKKTLLADGVGILILCILGLIFNNEALAAFIMAVIIAIYNVCIEKRFYTKVMRCTETVEGIIDGFKEKKFGFLTTFAPIVSYSIDGSAYELSGNYYYADKQIMVGDSVDIKYNPSDPSDAFINAYEKNSVGGESNAKLLMVLFFLFVAIKNDIGIKGSAIATQVSEWLGVTEIKAEAILYLVYYSVMIIFIFSFCFILSRKWRRRNYE